MSELTVCQKLYSATFAKGAADRTYLSTLSTSDPDRESDRIRASGWVIPRHVPLLWAHNPRELPIGKVRDIAVVGATLRGRIEFPPPGTYDFADTVVRLIEADMLGAVSVGFRPLKTPRPNDLGGFDFDGTELHELSVVNVPAHPTATIDGRMNEVAVQKWLADETDGAIVLHLDDDIVLRLVDDVESPIALAISTEPTAVTDRAARHDVFNVDRATFEASYRDTMPGLLRAGLEAARAQVPQAVQLAVNRARGRVD